jgi:hypothetical protein
VWEDSWRRDYGWPRKVYGEFGYDPSIAMHYWDPEGLVFNGRVILGVAAGVFGAAFAFFSASRPVMRDS